MIKKIKLHFTTLPLLAILVFPTNQLCAQQDDAANVFDPDAARMAQVEEIVRLEQTMALNRLVEEGEKLLRAKDNRAARERFNKVLEESDATSANEPVRQRARQGLAAVAAAQARAAESEGTPQAAIALWQDAVRNDPANSNYARELRRLQAANPTLQQRYSGNTAVTEDLAERVANIQRLMFEGDSLYQTGQYGRAISRYREILMIDPYHRAARQRIERLDKTREAVANVRRKAEKERAMAEVEEAWATKIRPLVRVDEGAETTLVTESRVAKLINKLESIRIPELNFTDVDVADAIRFLEEQSVALDPTGQGVNFVLKAEPTVVPGSGEDAPAAQPRTTPITLNLRDIPLVEVLRFITQLTPLQFKVEEFAVYIFPGTETSEVMVNRTFPVPPNFFTTTIEPQAATGVSAPTVNIVTADVKQELTDKGVAFPPGSSAAYLPRTARLVVRNTFDQINVIEQLLAQQDDMTTQIEIETKFIEFTEDKLKDLSFNWALKGDGGQPGSFNIPGLDPALLQNLFGTTIPQAPNAGTNLRGAPALSTARQSSIDGLLGRDQTPNTNLLTLSGIVGGYGVRAIISALESTTGADLMSAPRVTVVSGEKSKIRIAREFFFPDDYDPPEIPEPRGSSGGGTTIPIAQPIIPSTPRDFVSRDLGVLLDVRATATADRRIDLELTPEVVEFQGFINFADNGRSITVPGGGAPNRVGEVLVVSLRPVFEVRKIETKVQVLDGQTVVMGGLIREDRQEVNDKVPLLGDLPLIGRAFRSKASSSIKRNLIVFTTARLVNPDGTPRFLTETEQDILESSLPTSVSNRN